MLPVSEEINESDPGQEQKNLRPLLLQSLGLIQPSPEHPHLWQSRSAPTAPWAEHPEAADRCLSRAVGY